MISIDLETKTVRASYRIETQQDLYTLLKIMWHKNRMLIQYPFPCRAYCGFLLTTDCKLPVQIVPTDGWTIEWPVK